MGNTMAPLGYSILMITMKRVVNCNLLILATNTQVYEDKNNKHSNIKDNRSSNIITEHGSKSETDMFFTAVTTLHLFTAVTTLQLFTAVNTLHLFTAVATLQLIQIKNIEHLPLCFIYWTKQRSK